MKRAGTGRAAGVALVLLAACAGPKRAPQDLPLPTVTEPIVEPVAGATEAEVVARNGAQDSQETVDADAGVCTGASPGLPGLPSATAQVRSHDGVGVPVHRGGVLPVPVPTFPHRVGRAAQDLPRVR